MDEWMLLVVTSWCYTNGRSENRIFDRNNAESVILLKNNWKRCIYWEFFSQHLTAKQKKQTCKLTGWRKVDVSREWKFSQSSSSSSGCCCEDESHWPLLGPWSSYKYEKEKKTHPFQKNANVRDTAGHSLEPSTGKDTHVSTCCYCDCYHCLPQNY